MNLKSLVDIEITSAKAKRDSDIIVGGLNNINKSAKEATASTSNLNSQFDKTGKAISTGYSQASSSARTFGQAVDAANQKANSFPTNATRDILAYGAAYLSVRSAVGIFLKTNADFETGMIGVAKTTNLAGKDLEDFKNRILETSKSIPVSTNELLELAQAAGQMGVRGADNLEKFATTMAKVSRSTDLAGADAARMLARILTVSGESTDKLDVLANVIVRMGNNSKATESEIAGMTTRISQSLAVFGIASAQSVALAAAMKSVGITAEQGGSAVGRSMQEITNAVLGGGKALQKFSKELNLDPEKLKTLFNTDKMQSFNYFLEGVASKGLAAGLSLEKIGLGGTEIIAAIGPLSNNLNVLRDAQAQVNDELKNGTALNKEFNSALDTFNNQLKISGNIVSAYGQKISSDLFGSVANAVKSFNEASQTGGLNRLVDVLTLLSLVVGGKLVGSLAAYSVAAARNIQVIMAEGAAYTESAARAAIAADLNKTMAAQKLIAAEQDAASAVAVVQAERQIQISRINSLKSIAAEIEAEKLLEMQRMKSQISVTGSAMSIERLKTIRLEEVAIINQVQRAEATLAATTVESNTAATIAIQRKAAAELESTLASRASTVATAGASLAIKEYSLTATLATGATRALGGAMALLGGPAGVIFLAAGALAYFAMRTTDAEAAVEALGQTTEEAVKKFQGLSDLKQNRVLDELKKQYADASSSAAKLSKDLDAVNKAKNFTTEKRRNELAIAFEEASEKVDSLKSKIDALDFEKSFGGLAKIVDDFTQSITPVETATETVTSSINTATDATRKLVTESKKLIDLYDNKKKAVEFAYDVEHNLIDITDEKSKNLILTNYKMYDSIVGLEEAYKMAGASAEASLNEIFEKQNKLNDKAIETTIDSKGFAPAGIPTEKDIEIAKKTADAVAQPWIEASNRINSTFADMWAGSFKSFSSFRKQLVASVQKMAGEIIHQLTTKKLTDALLNMAAPQGVSVGGAASSAVSSAGSSSSSGGAAGVGMMGMMGAAGPYALAAVAVVAAVSAFNKKQDEKFLKMTSEYKQANQGLSKVLGEGNKKSDAINTSIQQLQSVGANTLGVNRNMLDALLDIRAGIGNVAAGFAKTIIGGGDVASLGIKQGTTTNKVLDKSILESNRALADIFSGGGSQLIDKFADNIGTNFFSSIANKISSSIFNTKTKVIDTGIHLLGGTLQSIFEGGIIQAQSYADVKTTKKVFGVKAGSKSNRTTQDLDQLFEEQISGVFENVGKALEISSKTFGIDFNSKVSQLLIKSQDLSLQGLEGDALTKEIESFFGATMDSWAETLLGGTDVLIDFQKIGESAFETMVRLSSQTEGFSEYVKLLGLDFKAVGLDAVYATQAMADTAGGFDSLSSKLSNYYDKFFTDAQKSAAVTGKVGEAFKSLNISVPKTRAAFQELMNKQNLLTDSGRETANSLLELVPLLDQYYTSLGDMQAESNKNNLMSAAQLLEYSKKMKGAADSLLLSDLSPLTGGAKYLESKNQFNSATGEDIITAGQSYLEEARKMFASSSEYTKAFEEVQKRLRDEAVSTSAGNQPSSSGQAIAASVAVAQQATTESTNSAAVANDPMFDVVNKLVETNKTLTEQLNATVVILETVRKDSDSVALVNQTMLENQTTLIRKTENIVTTLEANARRR